MIITCSHSNVRICYADVGLKSTKRFTTGKCEINTKMSLQLNATSFRYESMKTKRPSQHEFKGNVRPQQYGWNEREPNAVSDQAIMEREKWNERLDEVWWRKRAYREKKIKQEEITLANREISLIRRERMKELYNQEHVKFEKELNESQKTFYKKRI